MSSNKDLVKYNNDLNKLNMSNLKDKELELFYAICLELKEKGTDIITIDISDFRKQFNIVRVNNTRFNDYLDNVQDKFLSLKHTLKTDKRVKKGTFFYDFDADLTTNKMLIRINPEYSYILNGIVEYYTQFSFTEFQSLKSKYSRILMPKLAQWNSVKKLEIKKEELFDLLGVPQSYLKDISNFNKKVLKVLKEDLPNVFNNLKIKPIKNKIGNSKNQISSYIFSWSDKTEIKEAEEVKTIEISKKIKTLLDEAVKNEKLEILEKPSIIQYLTKHYEENILILGIKQLLNSNIKTKIKTRKYITAVLDKIKEQENIKIKIKDELKTGTNNTIVEEFKEKEKLEITEAEYNKLLDEEIENYIQETKKLNQSIDLEITKMSLKVKLNSKYKIKN
jgi:plasmid replication initiation protein